MAEVVQLLPPGMLASQFLGVSGLSRSMGPALENSIDATPSQHGLGEIGLTQVGPDDRWSPCEFVAPWCGGDRGAPSPLRLFYTSGEGGSTTGPGRAGFVVFSLDAEAGVARPWTRQVCSHNPVVGEGRARDMWLLTLPTTGDAVERQALSLSGLAPSLEAAIVDVRQFARTLPLDVPTPKVTTDGEQEVVITWRTATSRAVLSFEGDGSYGYALLKGDRFVPGEEDAKASGPFPKDLYAYLHESNRLP